MTNLIRSLLFGGFLFVFIACNQQADSTVSSSDTHHSVSLSYKPPVFIEDNRREKINAIAPQLEEIMAAHRDRMKIPGIAYGIVVDNELVISSAIGLINRAEELPATTQSCFRIASMSKSFTAMAIVKLRDEGKLLLSDPVSKYIPEMAGLEYLTSDAPTITIKNLLTMTAGFPEDNPWGDRQLDEPDQMLLDLVQEGIPFSNPTSHQYEYSNTGFALLGNVITRVSGKPYQEYIKESILEPLDMMHTYWEYDSIPSGQLATGYRWEDEQWKLEPMLHDGSYGAMGGLITTIEDFSNYVSFHLSAWPPRSEPDSGPVKRSTLREMQNPQNMALITGAKDWDGEDCPIIYGYGYGLSTYEDCMGVRGVTHGGALPGFGSNYFFFPDYGVGVMAFGNLTYTGPLPFGEIAELLFDSLDLQRRQLPVSDILNMRQEQVAQLIQSWDPDLENAILAENFYLDKDREHRMVEIEELLNQAGAIKSMEDMVPENQLRGSFELIAEHGDLSVYFTLSPEKDPKVQQLDVTFQSHE